MRSALFISLVSVALFAGLALAQQNAPSQDTQGQTEASQDSAVDITRPTPQAETDLGNSVDDLLRNGLPAPVQEGSETLLDEEEPEEIEVAYDQYENATLRALDKITGRSTDIQVRTDTPIVFGSLNIEMKTCYQTPPELPPESAVFLSIKSTQAVQVESMDDAVDASDVSTVSDDNPKLFSGWMFASSPGLSALEHPVYDVWVIKCNAA